MELLKLYDAISNSDNIVFFGGAGVSTESGIPDFRSVDGLYNQEYKFPPETIVSSEFFHNNTEEFYEFYRKKMIHLQARPNDAHKKLAELEKAGKIRAVVTQNIDGLHQQAGSECVLELHGSIHRNNCLRCGRFYGLSHIAESRGVPFCECGGVVKPDVVLFGEGLGNKVIARTIELISKAEVLIVGGTSLGVYPAAGLINYFSGDTMILINMSETPFDSNADIVINGKIGEVMSKIKV